MSNIPQRKKQFVPGLAFNTAKQAWAELHDHADTLKGLGLTDKFGVSVDRLEGQPGWGIYIREYDEEGAG